jgi:hypothetical protein
MHVGEGGAKIQTQGTEINEIIAESFPDTGKDVDVPIQKALKTPTRHDQKRISPCHTVVKMPKLKNKE